MRKLYVPTPQERAILEKMQVVILTPCKDYEVPFRFARSVVNMTAYSWQYGCRVYQLAGIERMPVHWSRQELCRQVKDRLNEETGDKFTHVLWLDDDHIFSPDLLVYLARHQEKDVVSAVYYGRVGRHLPVVYVKDSTPDKYKFFPIIEVPPALCEVDAVGFGACLMRRDVLDRMPEPWFTFAPGGVGEDIYFCVHAKEAGIRIWCEGSYTIGHFGEPQVITQETYRQFLEKNADEYSDRIKVSLGGQVHG
jgi:hypothetical protein